MPYTSVRLISGPGGGVAFDPAFFWQPLELGDRVLAIRRVRELASGIRWRPGLSISCFAVSGSTQWPAVATQPSGLTTKPVQVQVAMKGMFEPSPNSDNVLPSGSLTRP